jgi:hypothetical protein
MGLPPVSNGIRLRNVPPATAIICRHTGPLARVSDILLRNEHLKNYLIMNGFT